MFGNRVERQGAGEVGDATGYYLKLLGMDRLPESPREMPRELVLPAEIFGNIGDVILLANNREIGLARVVYFDPGRGLVYTNIHAGSHIRSRSTELFEGVFWKGHFRERPLLSYGVYADGDWRFRAEELAVDMEASRRALMICVGSMQGIEMLLQTKETLEGPSIGRVGFVGKGRDWGLLSESEFDEMRQREMARLAEGFGFGYYSWSPAGESLTRGEIAGELVFSRVSLLD